MITLSRSNSRRASKTLTKGIANQNDSTSSKLMNCVSNMGTIIASVIGVSTVPASLTDLDLIAKARYRATIIVPYRPTARVNKSTEKILIVGTLTKSSAKKAIPNNNPATCKATPTPVIVTTANHLPMSSRSLVNSTLAHASKKLAQFCPEGLEFTFFVPPAAG